MSLVNIAARRELAGKAAPAPTPGSLPRFFLHSFPPPGLTVPLCPSCAAAARLASPSHVNPYALQCGRPGEVRFLDGSAFTTPLRARFAALLIKYGLTYESARLIGATGACGRSIEFVRSEVLDVELVVVAVMVRDKDAFIK